MKTVRILNWSNRRATAPVEAAIASFAASHPDCTVTQVERPLSDFEHQGIEGVAAKFDLVVFDHPFCGRIAETGCFEPLDGLLPDLLGADRGHLHIGPSLDTYRFEGRLWGAPIDGATQNAIYRADLLAGLGHGVPRSHDDVLALGKAARARGLYLGTAIETPHALMSIFSLMANLGAPVEADGKGIRALPRAAFETAYDALARIVEMSPPEALGWNSIELHEALVARDDIVYSPAVYGYATYGEADMRKRLSFGPFAGIAAPFEAGSTIGGTAFGLSATAQSRDAALQFIDHMLRFGIEHRAVGRHHGQAAALAEWRDPEIDGIFNGFHFATRSSMETSWVRPRFSGYSEFQRSAGQAMAEAYRNGHDSGAAYRALRDMAGIAAAAEISG